MSGQDLNYTSGIALIALAVLGLLAVLSTFRGRHAPGGRAAQLFESCVHVMCGLIVVYLATADWSEPSGARPLAYTGVLLATSFGAQQWRSLSR